MKTLTAIKAEKETKVTELIKESGMFFAFNSEQFETNKTLLQEGEKYVSAGAGAYLPKSKVSVYIDGMKAINDWYKAEIKNGKVRTANIEYELANYECYYTGDIDDALAALGSDYTRAEVQGVFNTNRKLHLND